MQRMQTYGKKKKIINVSLKTDNDHWPALVVHRSPQTMGQKIFRLKHLIISSAVAVIADRTASTYGILAKSGSANYQLFPLQIYERLTRANALSDSTGRVYERTQTLSTQA